MKKSLYQEEIDGESDDHYVGYINLMKAVFNVSNGKRHNRRNFSFDAKLMGKDRKLYYKEYYEKVIKANPVKYRTYLEKSRLRMQQRRIYI